MDISLQKRISARHRAVLAGLGVLGCCVFANLAVAQVSSAAVPSGIDCSATEGKISGRGSTYQTLLLGDLSAAYSSDFCGSVAEQYAGDPAGNTMLAYNYAAAETAGATGSGAGTKAASCRTDAFWGSDTPYTEETLKALDEAPGKFGGTACELTFKPPYTPQAEKEVGGKQIFPSTSDITAPLMSFPVGGSSVALIVNFGTACTKDPTSLELNATETSRLFGGDVATWADKELAANNPALATDGCTGAVTRVVRQDSSGTTNIFKQYLIRADNNRATGESLTCAAGKKWEAYFSTNTEWPGKQHPTEEGTCSTITTAAKSGNPELIAKLKETQGGIGYADLPQAAPTGLVIATVENSAGTGYASAANGKAANCSYASVQPPTGGVSEAVGLSPEEKNWANNAEPNEENVTDRGSKYPICGLTWDLVYTGLSNTSSSAIAHLTGDQRRTLYSFFTFVLSSTAQNVLSTIDYAPLPSGWLQGLREGFQENF